MKILICPIKRLYQILSENAPGNCCAVISSSAEIDINKLRKIPYIFRCYDDLDYDCPGRSISGEDAAAFAAFLRNQAPGIDTLYCCCDAGESRSPAVAAAVMRWMEMDDLVIWRNPRYHPNMLVFEKLSQALKKPVSDGELDLRLYENQKAFRDAIRR